MPAITPHIQGLHAYTPGLQPQSSGWIKLNTNENPYPPSPKVHSAILAELGTDATSLRLYPEPISRQLRATVASLNGLKESQVFFGNGSDEVLKYLVWAYTDGTLKAAMLDPSYSLYPVLTGIKNSSIIQVPLSRSMELPVDKLINSGANLILITQPNAPTGVAFPLNDLRALVAKTQSLVVIDEAYSAFADETAVPLLAEFDNVCITRTFSKSHSLAGLRIGYVMGCHKIMDTLDRVRDAYNLDRIAQAAALAALEDSHYFLDTIQKIKTTRDDFRSAIEKLGWFIFPSKANFVFVEPRNSKGENNASVAQAFYHYLESKKILVRYFGNNPFTSAGLRITIGLPHEMNLVVKTFAEANI